MKILIASVTNAPEDILSLHLASISRLSLLKGCSSHLAYITDPGLPPESLSLLEEHNVEVLKASPKPKDAFYEVNEEGHDWSKPTFYWLAEQKETLLRKAEEESYDAIFFVDSDLVLDEDTLSSLITSKKEVVSAVFWTRWTPNAPPMPQVWITHPYEFQGKGIEAHEFIRALTQRELIRVGGLGACTLIRSKVFSSLSWLPVEGLPEGGMWQGEDRHFCVRATRSHVPLWADAWPDIRHLYRPGDVEVKYKTLPKRKSSPRIGDLVSFVLEPTEEEGLAKDGFQVHLRGRLGTLRILPGIEDALLEMKAGEDRLVRVRFPMWWSKEDYRGKVMAILVRLLGVKPFRLAPTLDEFERSPEFLFDEFYEEEDDS